MRNDSLTSNEVLYVCECSEVYGSHHPECPARRQFEGQQAEIERLRAENDALRHDLERAMANHVADINADESAPIPPTQTRRDAFLAWWKSVWAPDDPRSSPGFDAAMEQWSWDAWRAGGDYERQRLSVETTPSRESQLSCALGQWLHDFGSTNELSQRTRVLLGRTAVPAEKASEPTTIVSDGVCRESAVRGFLGWLSGRMPELHQVEVPRLAAAWEEYKGIVEAAVRDGAFL